MEKTVHMEYLKIIENFKSLTSSLHRRSPSPPKLAKKMNPYTSTSLEQSRGKIATIGTILQRNMDKLQFHKVFKDESPSQTLTIVIKNYF
jgi:hypothetical protein